MGSKRKRERVQNKIKNRLLKEGQSATPEKILAEYERQREEEKEKRLQSSNYWAPRLVSKDLGTSFCS